jgi:hypothetical protein
MARNKNKNPAKSNVPLVFGKREKLYIIFCRKYKI